MKKLVILLTALLLFIVPLGSAFANGPLETSDKAISLKVMSYNIHHAAGIDGVLSLERIAKVIEDSGAEIFGLQEVDNHWSDHLPIVTEITFDPTVFKKGN